MHSLDLTSNHQDGQICPIRYELKKQDMQKRTQKDKQRIKIEFRRPFTVYNGWLNLYCSILIFQLVIFWLFNDMIILFYREGQPLLLRPKSEP